MQSVTFTAENGHVLMCGLAGPVRLSPASIDQMLDIFQREGALDLFDALSLARADLAVAPLRIPVLEPLTISVRMPRMEEFA